MAVQTSKVFVVDNDPLWLIAFRRVLRGAGYDVETFDSVSMFLSTVGGDMPGCLVLEAAMPGMSGLQVQQVLLGSPAERPIIFLSGQPDIRLTVHAMKAGAVDFLTKPVQPGKLLAAVAEAVRRDVELRRERAAHFEIRDRFARLTRRERQVFRHVVHGRLNKQIAADLGTVEKTIKVHRARVMRKMRVRTLADLVLLAYLAGMAESPELDGEEDFLPSGGAWSKGPRLQ
jgi:FixJ family two-component response regulator